MERWIQKIREGYKYRFSGTWRWQFDHPFPHRRVGREGGVQQLLRLGRREMRIGVIRVRLRRGLAAGLQELFLMLLSWF